MPTGTLARAAGYGLQGCLRRSATRGCVLQTIYRGHGRGAAYIARREAQLEAAYRVVDAGMAEDFVIKETA